MGPHSSSSALIRWSSLRFNYYNVEFVCFFENGLDTKFEFEYEHMGEHAAAIYDCFFLSSARVGFGGCVLGLQIRGPGCQDSRNRMFW